MLRLSTNRRRAGRRFALAGALVLYLAFLAYQSLAGGSPRLCERPLADPGSGWYGSDALANLVAYVPAGLLAGALAASFGRFGARILAWLLLTGFSLSMELVQACLSERVSSWVDAATNSAGSAFGLVALPFAIPLLHRLASHDLRRGRVDAQFALAAWLVVGAWIASSTAPWRFTFDVGTVRSNLSFLRLAPSLDAWDVVRHAFAWMTVAVALRALFAGRLRASIALVAALALSLGAQAFLEWRALSWSELAGAALGVFVALVLLVPAANGPLARIVSVLALVSVAAYELAPGRAGWGAGDAFSWWPLIGRGHLLAALDFALYFCWFAFVPVLALRWKHARAPAAIASGSFAVAALFALEVAQRWIPGRTADTSPALIGALAFAVAWLLTERSGERATVPVLPTAHRSALRSARRP
ncbi:MAG TPA: VanZ family protein [Zeimonas sp.]